MNDQQNEFLVSTNPVASMNASDTFKAICRVAMDVGGSGSDALGHPDDWGSYRFAFDFREGGRLCDDVPGATLYDSGTDFADVLQGTYEGRPYFVVAKHLDQGGNFRGTVYVSLSGEPDRFIEGIVNRYQLVPATPD